MRRYFAGGYGKDADYVFLWQRDAIIVKADGFVRVRDNEDERV